MSHWEEVAANKEKVDFNPDYDKYKVIEDTGSLHIVTARKEGVLIGYFVSFLTPSIHYKDHVFALNDVLYVAEKYRGGSVAFKMFIFAESHLKKLGVSVIFIHMKVYAPFDKLCLKLGYTNVERSYSKYIGD